MIGSFLLYMTVFTVSILFWNIAQHLYSYNKSCYVACLIASFILPFFLSAFRCVGTDYLSYIRIYELISKQNWIQFLRHPNENVEFGYYVINRISYLLCDSPIPVFVITSFLVQLMIFKILLENRNMEHTWIGLFAYYMVFYSFSFNGIRFALAVMIYCYALNFLMQNKKKKYVIWIIATSLLFHTSAIICLANVMLIYISDKKLRLIQNIIFITAIIFSPIMLHVFFKIIIYIPVFNRYKHYEINLSNGGLGFLAFVLPFLSMTLLLWKNTVSQMPSTELYFHIALLQIPLRYAGYYQRWASRMEYYSLIVYIPLIPIILKCCKKRKNKYIVIIYYVSCLLIDYYVRQVIWGYHDVYPYMNIYK